jgi:hypothetical protein
MKDAYKKLQVKFKTPDWDALDNEFELYLLEHEDFLLKNIAKKMIEKLEFYAKIIDELYHPESNIAIMHMSGRLTNEDKAIMHTVFRRLEFRILEAVELDLSSDEKAYANYINSVWQDWPGMKAELLKVIRKLKDSWTNEQSERFDNGYMG